MFNESSWSTSLSKTVKPSLFSYDKMREGGGKYRVIIFDHHECWSDI